MLDVSRTEQSADMEDLNVCNLSEDDRRKSSNKLVLKLDMPHSTLIIFLCNWVCYSLLFHSFGYFKF